MKKYDPFKSILFLVIGILLLVTACKKDPEPDPDPDLPEEILILNNWIWEGMNDVYLWDAFIPNMDPDVEPDPKAFFNKLLYSADHDSWIVDDYDELVARFDGVQLATGMSAHPGYITDTQVISIVEYVTPNSPAADSGIVRGDIIMTIDGNFLTDDNYFDLYYQTTATFEFGNWDGINMIPNGKTVTLTALELNQNPIVHHEIIEYQDTKIGYFVYTQFTAGQNDEWFNELKTVFGDFKSAGISDVVVDLRYNGGGSLGISAYMASTLGSLTAMESNDVYVNLVWNEDYNQYWKQADLDNDGNPDGEDSNQLVIRLPDSDLNMNLSTVYFLTTGSTASASESLMVGLYPYTNVVQIGATTYGKCYASLTIDDWATPKRHNWAMQPIVLKYSNADGYTDFVNGLLPDYVIEEYLLDLQPFGNMDDPLLAEALTQITGLAPAGKKSLEPETRFITIPIPRKQIPELMIVWPDKPGASELF